MYRLSIVTIYRNSINYFYSGFYILSMIFPIWTIYTFSIKSCYSYLNIFSILPPIISLYRLTIATHYKHLYIKYIGITYNISYKGSLYFAIPSVLPLLCHYLPLLPPPLLPSVPSNPCLPVSYVHCFHYVLHSVVLYGYVQME